MLSVLRRPAIISVMAVGIPLFAASAKADPVLPVQNLTFTSFTGFPPKTIFTAVNPTNWTGGTGLISIDGPATVDSSFGAATPDPGDG